MVRDALVTSVANTAPSVNFHRIQLSMVPKAVLSDSSILFLIIHSIFLGIKFDYDLYKFFRRFVLLAFIIFEIVAQSLLVFRLFKLKSSIKDYFNNYALILKLILVSILVVVAILSLPIVVTSGNVHFKHALEWNYFVGVILFYFLTYLFWKKV